VRNSGAAERSPLFHFAARGPARRKSRSKLRVPSDGHPTFRGYQTSNPCRANASAVARGLTSDESLDKTERKRLRIKRSSEDSNRASEFHRSASCERSATRPALAQNCARSICARINLIRRSGAHLNRVSFLGVLSLLFGLACLAPSPCFGAPGDPSDSAAVIAAAPDSTSAAESSSASLASAPIAYQPAAPAAPAPAVPQAVPSGNYGWFIWGIGLDASSLGLGGQIAVQVLDRANVRVGFNGFDYHGSSTSGGILYTGNLNLASVNANFDYFLSRNFRVSPGVLIYDNNYGAEKFSIAAGEEFTYGNSTYESSSASPIAGTARLGLDKVAPEILFGWGNMIPRRGKRWGFEADAGVAYQGSPKVALALNGFVCTPPNSAGATCVNAATDPSVQANIRIQEGKVGNEVSIFRFCPVVSFGISYSF
jgi:hypothetical protein